MIAQFTWFTPLYIFVGASALAITANMFVWRTIASVRAWLLLSTAVGCWSIFYGMELMRGDQAWIMLWVRLEYIAIVVVSPAWLLFALVYSGREQWFRPLRLSALFAVPLIGLILAWSNRYHGLFWQEVRIAMHGDLMLFSPVYGIGFWSYTIVSYSYLIVGGAVLVRDLFKRPQRSRGAVLALLAAMAAPLVGNLIYLMEIPPFADIDATPLGFAVSCAAAAIAISRLHLFDLTPIARSTVAEQIADGIVVLNEYELLVDLNQSAAHTLGAAVDALIGRSASEVFADWPDLTNRLRFVSGDEILRVHHHNDHWLSVRITPIYDKPGRLRGVLLVWRNISTEHQTELALRMAKETAEAANRAKTAFLANTSHELRTPLTAILGYSQLMQLRLQRGEYAELPSDLHAIEDAGARLMEHIRNLLQLAQIEAGSTRLQLVETSVTILFDDVREAGRKLAERRNNRLVVQMPAPTATIRTDPLRLFEVLLHLIDNAAKFTENGTITLTFEQVPGPQGNLALFHISDTGVGLRDAEFTSMFTTFNEPDEQKRRVHGGMGIGLAISLQLSRLLGGDVGAAKPDRPRCRLDEARDRGCHRVWLTTTNDNLRGLRFYQRVGFRMILINIGAVDEARKIKPQIPKVGQD
ncbi:MAG: GNAT family N-acetyltransferase, partial [Oscillochloris sp.]|nr:GNAT family N-acetyltransferase [Oscillochloris sp.]